MMERGARLHDVVRDCHGCHCTGSVTLKTTTLGRCKAAAMCMGPESLPITIREPAIRAISSRISRGVSGITLHSLAFRAELQSNFGVACAEVHDAFDSMKFAQPTRASSPQILQQASAFPIDAHQVAETAYGVPGPIPFSANFQATDATASG